MIRRHLAAAAMVAGTALALSTGCDKKSGQQPVAPLRIEPILPSQAHPKMNTMKLWLGPEELTVELALSVAEQTAGMMFRTNMAENEGMLFVFGIPHRASFWMKNTPLPLSAAYIDPEGVILEIHDLHPHNTNSVVAGSDRIQFVLETRQGWFQRHKIEPGTVLRTERGSLKETFFNRNRY